MTCMYLVLPRRAHIIILNKISGERESKGKEEDA